MRIWTFKTKRFKVTLDGRLDPEPDLSWRDAEQVKYDDENGVRYYEFAVRVFLDGEEIAADYLGGSGYSEPREFGTAHRDADPMNRNCTIYRASPGNSNSVLCHYFPGMVGQAIHHARQAVGAMRVPPRLRHVGG